ncbi:MAG: LysM domain-containing protein [Chthoniobacteraceae bacterium]
MRALLFSLSALALFAGCDRLFDKGSKDELAAGDKKAAAGDFHAAVGAYEAALDGTEKTANAHWKLALIYDDKLKVPRDAIHHFERYLDLAPNGSHAKDAKAMLKQAETRLALAQGKGSFMTQEDAVRLKNENLRLNKLLAEVRAQKAMTPVPVAAGGKAGKAGEQPQKPVAPGQRTHVVKPGETMASIAQLYYKNKGKWKDIQDANFYSTNGTPKIKPGQTLIIP